MIISNFTSLEYKLLDILINNKNHIVTKDFLLECIYNNTGNYVYDNTLRVYIKRMRYKLNGLYDIKTVRGLGYYISQ